MTEQEQASGPIDVLLVEDSQTQVVLMEYILESNPHLNLAAHVADGEQAMQYLNREGQYADARRPGLVLLDINMPVMDGFEVLKQMKENPELVGIPVVMLTASADELDKARSYEQGASTFLTKPPQAEDLERILSDLSREYANLRMTSTDDA